jgi:hypothetical protein
LFHMMKLCSKYIDEKILSIDFWLVISGIFWCEMQLLGA